MTTNLTTLPELDLPHLNERFERLLTPEILQWAWESFGAHAAASSSFQTQSVPLLHLISQICPDMPVIFLDTGLHFPETLRFRDELQARFKLNIVDVRPVIGRSELAARYGVSLPEHDPDLCCYLHKVEPMQRALSEFRAWISGTRRDQTGQRQGQAILDQLPSGLLKIQPMLNWIKIEINDYIEKYNLPRHPLFGQGYRSIGCAPCTQPSFAEDERAGRWAGLDKTECGLHTGLMNSTDIQVWDLAQP
ncbi:MAG: phosphoadenylyl-sulfate reductase [Anaerolineae bacterium]